MNSKLKAAPKSNTKSSSQPRLPRARSCYICGRQYMIHSFPIHEAQCKEMFEKWEAQKPLKDRKKCPIDPMKGISLNPNMKMKELNEINAISYQAWNEQALVRCENCSRTFLPTQLVIHQRSCKSDNPAKHVSSNYQSVDNLLIDTSNVNINSGNLISCENCGRKFNPPSYVKHAKICVKVFSQKRKTFDSSKHRAMGTDLEEYHNSYNNKNTKNYNKKISMGIHAMNTNMKYNSDNNGTKGDKYNDIPKWKLDSIKFRESMKAARIVSKAEKKSKETGIPLHILLPSSSIGSSSSRNNHNNSNHSSHKDMDNALLCPTCGRLFNQKAGERHIPQCRNIINKPKVLLSGSGLPSYSSTTTINNHNKALHHQFDERKNPIKMNNTMNNSNRINNTINSITSNIKMNNAINSISNSDKTRRNSFGISNYPERSLKQTSNTASSIIRLMNTNSSGSTRKDMDRHTSISKSKVSFEDIKPSFNNTSYDINQNITSNKLNMSINNTMQYNNRSNIQTSSGLNNNSSKPPPYQLQQCNQTSPDNPLAIKRFK